jgi:hypothetical protein
LTPGVAKVVDLDNFAHFAQTIFVDLEVVFDVKYCGEGRLNEVGRRLDARAKQGLNEPPF